MPAEDDRTGSRRSGLMRHHRPRQTARRNAFFGAAARLLMQELSTTVLFEEHERTFTKKH